MTDPFCRLTEPTIRKAMMPETFITDSVPALFGLLLFIELVAAFYLLANKKDRSTEVTITDFLQWSFVLTGFGFIAAVALGQGGSTFCTALLWLCGANFVAALLFTIVENHRNPQKVIEREISLQ